MVCVMVIERAPDHPHAPAERLFCRAGDVCGHSGPAISLAARDSFVAHFVTTFASALAEASHLRAGVREGAVRHATAPRRESR